ncbi:MAG TPA: hypothetical protein VFS20_16265 [Longimicrobium sp.]|nr:hypothetical protein [Longimicrobium sp.]
MAARLARVGPGHADATQRDTLCLRPTAPSDCQSFVERTVWDGDQVIFEIRANSEPGASAVTTEQDAAAMRCWEWFTRESLSQKPPT